MLPAVLLKKLYDGSLRLQDADRIQSLFANELKVATDNLADRQPPPLCENTSTEFRKGSHSRLRLDFILRFQHDK